MRMSLCHKNLSVLQVSSLGVGVSHCLPRCSIQHRAQSPTHTAGHANTGPWSCSPHTLLWLSLAGLAGSSL